MRGVSRNRWLLQVTPRDGVGSKAKKKGVTLEREESEGKAKCEEADCARLGAFRVVRCLG